MYKGTKLSEFEKGNITALKKVGKSLREISKALGCRKTLSAYIWKVQINIKQENRLAGKKNYHHNPRKELFAK